MTLCVKVVSFISKFLDGACYLAGTNLMHRVNVKFKKVQCHISTPEQELKSLIKYLIMNNCIGSNHGQISHLAWSRLYLLFPSNCFETDQSQIYPKLLLCFDSHLLVNTSRCSSQHLSVNSSKHCLCLQLELRPTGTPVRLNNPDYLGLKTQT